MGGLLTRLPADPVSEIGTFYSDGLGKTGGKVKVMDSRV